MSRATPDDQLKFLLSCVKHSNNGKIDFIEVAHECGVVSKGAAAKRYERLMKANGIHPNGGPSEKPPTPSSTSKERSKAAIARAATAKRRKIEGDSPRSNNDSEFGSSHLKHEPLGYMQVKPEPMHQAGIFPDHGMTHAQYNRREPPSSHLPVYGMALPMDPPSALVETQYTLEENACIFDDFCTPELFMNSFDEKSNPDYFPPQLPTPSALAIRTPEHFHMQQGKSKGEDGGTESIIIAD